MASQEKSDKVVATARDEEILVEFFDVPGEIKKLDRNFNLLSIASAGAVTGSTWPPLGGSLVLALYNGGPPGVIYEFIAVSVCYWFVAASISELASAIPSSAGVYHFASITAGARWSKANSWFAGWWNFFAWIFGASSVSAIVGNIIIAMYGLFHPDYVSESWHVFVVYVIVTWMACLTVAYANKALPILSQLGLIFLVGGGIATVLVCAIMPSTTGSGYASNSFVWKDWVNQTGYSSDGFAFVMGMLNGAYAVGAVDVGTHLAEEVPDPRKNVPKAIFAQYIIGFTTTLCYLIVIFYAVVSLDDVYKSGSTFPISQLYQQATGTRGGAFGLLLIILFNIACTSIGTYITASRVFWTLARDGATPFDKFFSRLNVSHRNPVNSILLCGCVCTVMGAIYVGSTTAFNALIGSFVILSTLSYVAAILPHVLSRRKNVKPGPFWMRGMVGMLVSVVSSAYILCFIVIFCFPYALPVDAGNMNYACLITGGLTILIGLWYLWKRGRGYVSPRDAVLALMGHES